MPLLQALEFILINVLQMYIFVVLIRFLLQVAKADFYNPLSQFVVKATTPPLKPLRRLIPGIAGLDIASIVLALLLQALLFTIDTLIPNGDFMNPLRLVIFSIASIIASVVKIYLFCIFISAILSWFPSARSHPIAQLVSQLVEPALKPIRKILPDMEGIDISPMFAALILFAILNFLIPPLFTI